MASPHFEVIFKALRVLLWSRSHRRKPSTTPTSELFVQKKPNYPQVQPKSPYRDEGRGGSWDEVTFGMLFPVYVCVTAAVMRNVGGPGGIQAELMCRRKMDALHACMYATMIHAGHSKGKRVPLRGTAHVAHHGACLPASWHVQVYTTPYFARVCL